MEPCSSNSARRPVPVLSERRGEVASRRPASLALPRLHARPPARSHSRASRQRASMAAACCPRLSGKKSLAWILASQRVSFSRSCSFSSHLGERVLLRPGFLAPTSSEKGGGALGELVILPGPGRTGKLRTIAWQFHLRRRSRDTFKTNPVPPCLPIVSRNCPKKSACGAESGSTQALFHPIVVAPIAHSQRQSATRALDGVLGSWAKQQQ